ncbi:MAG: pyridoxal phosphate-dependent aminotransferase [Flavobacteriales bacterium]|nr:pyridoxal phosphate-dependent aminotransferase [Flavobacteriales bacterium]
MKQHLSDTIQRLSESATLAMARMARELKEQGKDVISLSLGEPDFDTPDFIKDAAKQAIEDNFTHYPPVNGYTEVREAISRKFKRDNNLDYTADQIVVSTGAKQAIANVVLAIVSSGEEVILPAPYWVSYSELVKMANGEVVTIPTTIETDFKITPEQLEAAITPKTRMMIFSSPCNPSGTVYTYEELQQLAAVIERHPGLYVVSDEIYELINFSGQHASLGAFSSIYDQVITVNGVSKAFAMTGWRLGYLGAPLWIAKACAKMQGQFTSAPSGISQKAAEAAVNAPTSSVDYMKEEFLKRRDMVLDLLNAIPGIQTNIPEGAFYIFPDVTAFLGKSDGERTINSPSDLCMYLLEKYHIALVSGEAFGDDRCIRISYAASMETLREACKRIHEGLINLH